MKAGDIFRNTIYGQTVTVIKVNKTTVQFQGPTKKISVNRKWFGRAVKDGVFVKV